MSYSNKFLGSVNDNFVNNGSMDVNINSLQIQNLSPDQLVATDANKNLISVKYPTNAETPVFSAIDLDNQNCSSGTSVFNLRKIIYNTYFSIDGDNIINTERGGKYIIQYNVCGYMPNGTGVTTYISINDAPLSVDTTTLADMGNNTSGTASHCSLVLLNQNDKLRFCYVASNAFQVVSISLVITTYFIPAVSLQSTLQAQIDTINHNIGTVSPTVNLQNQINYNMDIVMNDFAERYNEFIILQNQVGTLSTKLNSLSAFLNLTFGQNF